MSDPERLKALFQQFMAENFPWSRLQFVPAQEADKPAPSNPTKELNKLSKKPKHDRLGFGYKEDDSDDSDNDDFPDMDAGSDEEPIFHPEYKKFLMKLMKMNLEPAKNQEGQNQQSSPSGSDQAADNRVLALVQKDATSSSTSSRQQ